ncbi:MAG: hypothetical protein JST84_15465 [Acidobacteria bacterium]|nr:hypothetical protein [Acidobacteriota bacterium]
MKNLGTMRRFTQALLLALLLNLSGHMFLHLSDAPLEADETHFTSHKESENYSAPQHQCSICQDQQQLALDSPSSTAYFIEVQNITPKRSTLLTPASIVFTNQSDRAPPRC